jgi:tetratricopeptide (TPR) repeat protein
MLSVLVLVLASHGLYGHGELHEVIDQLSLKIEASPLDAGLLLERAEYFRKDGCFRKALQDVAQARKLQPELKSCHLVRAKIYRDQKKWEPAKVELDTFMEAYPNDVAALVLRSRGCWKMGLAEQAESDIRRAIKLHARAPLSYYRQYIEFLLKRDDVETTLKVYADAEKSLGALPVLLAAKARMLRDRGRRDDAAVVYARLRETNPTLSFNWWREEALMWEVCDNEKMKQALLGARQSWPLLPARTRALPHLKLQHQAILQKSAVTPDP